MILYNLNELDWSLFVRHTKNKSDDEDDLGTIRVRARLSEERILPSQYYKPLIDVLMDSISEDKVRSPLSLMPYQKIR